MDVLFSVTMTMIVWMEPGDGLQTCTGKMTTASSEHPGRPKTTMTTTSMPIGPETMTTDSSGRYTTGATTRISHTSTSTTAMRLAMTML